MLQDRLSELIQACFTGIWVESHEHEDALAEISTLCQQEAWRLNVWDLEQGLCIPGQESLAGSAAGAVDPLAAIRSASTLAAAGSTGILVLVNFHRFLQSAEIVQALSRQLTAGKQSRTFVIILSPVVQAPTELDKLFVVVEHPLPSRAPPAEMKPVRSYLSFSSIRTYQSCPLKYFFKYIAGLPEESVSASLVFGSAIHRAIEHLYRQQMIGGAAPGVDELLTHYQAEWQERDAKPVRFGREDDAAALTDLAARMLTAFRESELAKPSGTILAIEEELRGPLISGLPDLLGRVDLIVETPSELLVSDWKSAPDVSVLAQQ
ncbi:PD-(D/E)XK nuclease superfamily protein [Anatilimnocola aggregata]|uniref:PD-(D/E)XK nuclease superfamily protein n=1 Tax=Anatilimnocola aggregata TaxID=2528021 RepID=A0A517YKD0_9BACT|nr:PD-(D/E)XK nuclease family protein [Anatilimnocola aggregata]QDU30684.1 PD-(D/E)XK nuclease superfamily protein [Anatilimnocola aggregata]